MPVQKYRVDTDKGSYEVEVDVPELKSGDPGFELPGGAGTAMLAGAKGFAKEAIPAVGKAVAGIPGDVVALVKELGSTAVGAGKLATDPVATLSDAWDSIKDIPGKAADATKKALDLAKNDPEAFGKAVADVTAQTEMGILASKAVPLAPKPAARILGATAEKIGTTGAWPIRMMGAHQLGSGNPMGLATMMVPEGLKKGGAALTKYGSGETDAAALEKFYGGPKLPEPKPKAATVQPNAPDMWDRARTPIAPVEPEPGSFSPAEIAKLRKQGYSPDMIARVQKVAAADARRVPPMAPPEGAGLGGVRAALPTPPGPAVRVAPNPMGTTPAVPSPTAPPDILGSYGRAGHPGAATMKLPSVESQRVLAEMEAPGYKHPMVLETGSPTTPMTPAELKAAGLSDMEAELTAREPKVPVPQTKSRNSPISAVNPELTEAEEAKFGFPKGTRITSVSPAIQKQISAERLERQMMHRTEAGLNKGAQTATDLDLEKP